MANPVILADLPKLSDEGLLAAYQQTDGKPNRTTFIALVVLDDAIRKLQSDGSLK